MRGMSTIPAPRRLRALRAGDDPVRAVRADAVRTDPVRADGMADALAAVAVETACGASGAGAVPQTSQ